MVDAEGADLVDVQLVKRPEYDGLSEPLGQQADYFNLLRLAALDFVDLGRNDMMSAPAAEERLYRDPEPAYTKLATDDLFAILPAPDTASLADIIFVADVVPPSDVAPPADTVLPVGDEAVDDVALPAAEGSLIEPGSEGMADGGGAVDILSPSGGEIPPELEALNGFIRKAFAAAMDDLQPGECPGFDVDGSLPCFSIDLTDYIGG